MCWVARSSPWISSRGVSETQVPHAGIMVLVLDTKTMAAVGGSSASRTAVDPASTPSARTSTTILVEVVVAEGVSEVKTIAPAKDVAATLGPPAARLKTVQKDEEEKSGECQVWHGTHR